LPLAIDLDADHYLTQRSEVLHTEFLRVDRLAQTNELPEASVIDGVLKITPLDNQESDEAELLTRQAYELLPRIKITDLLSYLCVTAPRRPMPVSGTKSNQIKSRGPFFSARIGNLTNQLNQSIRS
jgi:hypothetical protein